MTASLVAELKEADQDFEFYPTTNEIIEALLNDMRKILEEDGRGVRGIDGGSSVCDVGAGNGKVLRAFRAAQYCRYGDRENPRPMFGDLYAIEKSPLLCEQLDREIYIIGTDFAEQSLLNKSVDVVFSNPPYSVFEQWTVKIIREASARVVYLVIPQRWQTSPAITDALAFRNAEAEVISSFTFEDAEDRAARAKVHLLRIVLSEHRDDAFERFFDEQFGHLKKKFAGAQHDDADENRRARPVENPKLKALVPGANYPERMVALYNEEMDTIRRNYDMVADLDVELMRELEVTPDRILKCLKSRLAGTKNTYWRELFDRMKQVTDRLISKKRSTILQKLNESGNVDFTVGNIHAVVLWVLKNANRYIDEQVIDVFEQMVEKANVRNYKSNTRVFTYDRWRYNSEKPSHIALEYRLVLSHCGGLARGYSWEKGLSQQGAEFIGDLITVASNLGFECTTPRPIKDQEWASGETRVFYMAKTWNVGDKVPWTERTRKKIVGRVKLETGAYQYEIEGEGWFHEKLLAGEPLFEVRAFYNSNLHVRLNQKFALALNVEYGRLKGWLKNGAEAADELGEPDAPQYFGRNVQLGMSALPMLGAPVSTDEPEELRLEAAS